MSVHAGSVKQSTILNDAILPNRGSKAGLLERAFALMFRGLVYPRSGRTQSPTWRRWRSDRTIMS